MADTDGTPGATIHELAREDGSEAESPLDPEPEFEDDGTGQLAIAGTLPKLSTNVGGKRPETSTAKIASLSMPIRENAQFDMDERFWVAVEVEVADVGVRNLYDGVAVTGKVRHHTLKPLRVERLEAAPTAHE